MVTRKVEESRVWRPVGSEDEVEGRKLRTTSMGREFPGVIERPAAAVEAKLPSLEKLMRLTGLERRF